jgi:hypothetical protein
MAKIKEYLNEKIDLSKFNYKGNFDGEAYKSYIELVEGKKDEYGKVTEAGLTQTDLYDFVTYKAICIRKPLYPGLRDSPMAIVGIQIVNSEPVKTARTTLKRALTMNEQLEVTYDKRTPMEYYFLAKPAPSTHTGKATE